VPSFLQTGQLPLALNVPFTSVRENLEDQFGVARENILSRIPMRGGQLYQSLADVEHQRARAIGQIPMLELPTRQTLFSQALQAATQSPIEAAGQLGGIAGQLAGLNQIGFNQAAAAGGATANIFGDIADVVRQKNKGPNPGGGGLGLDVSALGAGGASQGVPF
jgi:hypothetical protein